MVDSFQPEKLITRYPTEQNGIIGNCFHGGPVALDCHESHLCFLFVSVLLISLSAKNCAEITG